MAGFDLSGKRVLLTQASDFMGPVLAEVFASLGAEVIADHGALDDPARPAQLVAEAGQVDILLAHLCAELDEAQRTMLGSAQEAAMRNGVMPSSTWWTRCRD